MKAEQIKKLLKLYNHNYFISIRKKNYTSFPTDFRRRLLKIWAMNPIKIILFFTINRNNIIFIILMWALDKRFDKWSSFGNFQAQYTFSKAAHNFLDQYHGIEDRVCLKITVTSLKSINFINFYVQLLLQLKIFLILMSTNFSKH